MKKEAKSLNEPFLKKETVDRQKQDRNKKNGSFCGKRTSIAFSV